ncbi:MAG: glycosyltransferase N-terminal domain-containing protein [Bacteroidales bacterium]|jgi:3-deoxy-D-manno-octulosonic-acid transferase
MTFLYDLGIRVFNLFIVVASLFDKKAKDWLTGRKGLFESLASNVSEGDKIIWFHVSSLGEFEQGRPLMEALKKNKKGYKILLTFFSPSGYLVRKDYSGADYVFYLPLDTRRNARKFLGIVKPEMVFFIKYEYWYHFLHQLKDSQSKVFLVSAIFRLQQLFFRSYGKWYRRMLHCFDHIFVQDVRSVELLASVSVRNVTLSGDTRFDRVKQIAGESKKIDIAERFASGAFTYVCGSTWEKDEEILIKYIDRDTSSRFIIAPHEISESHIDSLAGKLGKRAIRFSEAGGKLNEFSVLIIDNIGMLSAIYKYGHVAYVGGGFGAGIHNILEAAVYGLPVVFGPNYQRFYEAVELIKDGGAFSVSSYEECKLNFDELQFNKSSYARASKATTNFVTRNLGATDMILDYLKKS